MAVDLAQFAEGDLIPVEYNKHIIPDESALEGQWEEIKGMCDDDEAILKHSGVSWVKRVAMKTASLRTDISVKGKSEGGYSEVYMKSHYPLKITKDTSFVTDGKEFVQDDSADTCVWNATAAFANGKLMQRRVGSKGTMFDVRCVFERHPDGKSDVSPIMLFVWTLIDTKGEKHVSNHWMSKKK